MIYEWTANSRYSIPAQLVGETVERLGSENGGVCPPEALVEEARDEASPLHPVIFRLDRTQASEAWYRQEARQLINAVVIVQETSQARPAAFLSVSVVDESGVRKGYAPRALVAQQETLYVQALRDALAVLNGHRRRYRHLQELQPVWAALEGIDMV